ncbi:kinase-like domain-containing protein [Rhizophagus clarus]|uniref:Kinase-like domain-containing protein n=1 Tax=Rhizophagus clarus TaxID=94130 RepID=A0A8H3L6G7_9GLOM|nr:kinase-like domain-containing protein [Rhizophagus clarus]
MNNLIYETISSTHNKDKINIHSFTKTSEKEKIGLKCDVWETAKNYGKYITFKLKDNDYFNESTTKTKNAFELMRIASTLNYLPEFNLPKNSSDQLHIDLCELIKTKGSRWIGKDNANVIGKKFITDLSKSIWYIDSCSFKTTDDKYKIPEIFTIFFNRAHPENHKHA